MKILFLLMLLPSLSWSAPYFRLVDLRAPKVSVGTYADPVGRGTPDFGSAVALVTHSTKDGSIFQSFQCDWTPLGIGGGRAAGGAAFLALGPSANLAPAVKGLIIRGLDLVARGKYANIRELLAPVPGGGPDINIAFGPAWVVKPVDGGEFKDVRHWRGYFRIFAGAAWQF